MMAEMLHKAGVEVIFQGTNGQEVYDFALKENCGPVDFILLDLNMPIMNGY
jgi:chemotaxis response regulator CheB